MAKTMPPNAECLRVCGAEAAACEAVVETAEEDAEIAEDARLVDIDCDTMVVVEGEETAVAILDAVGPEDQLAII